ncbi:hypothetical protein ACWEFD_34240 [Streptomyces ardesiacus]
MTDAVGADRSRPFTLVVCGECGSAETETVKAVLRRAVRSCPRGVMVSTGCLGRFLHCRVGRGLYAAVQPCTPDRRPDGEVTAIGPLVREADAAEVAAWLRAGLPTGEGLGLTESLLAAPSPQRVARLN